MVCGLDNWIILIVFLFIGVEIFVIVFKFILLFVFFNDVNIF